MGIFDGSAIESHFKLCEWMPHAIDEFTVSFAPMAPAKKTLLVLGPEERFVKMAAASASPPAFAAVSDRGRVWSWGNYKANGHVTSTALPGDTIYGWSPFLIREEPRLLRCETDLVPEGDWITGVEAAGRYASFFVFTTEKGAFVRLVANPRCKEDGRDGRIDAKPYVPYVEDDKWIWKFFAKDDPERNGPMPGESEI
ncbi:hypothetical protein DFJ74DRAFT_678787 [Hyaloraphidium curvatum]|nr:hypothetical protein DFJ74DRAFT_678787 [Hyaloraphidium curvatum]